ncbi:nuclease domain-containing protein [Grimontia marina]|nr:nuclease domain-containing protein [Grimontia marina]
MNPETVVFAHFPSETHGIAYKSDDFWGADVCSACHDVIDGRCGYAFELGEREEYMLNGLHRTLSRRIRAGLITVEGGEYV